MVNKMDIVEQLTAFGLDSREAEVYITLLGKGNLTPTSLSRETGINRTTLYRILEKLVKLGLVKEALDYKSSSFAANPPESLSILFSQREIELKEMQKNLPEVLHDLEMLPKETRGPTKVFYYHGVSGLRQILWNTLNAKNEVVGFGYGDWNKGIGRKFAEKIRAEYVERKVRGKELLNEGLLDRELSFTDNKVYLQKYYEHRIIPRKKLVINHDTYIYNDVFAFYHIYRGELFGVEIHNAEIARTQRQIFEILWKMAKKT
ncbi:helix-turn-helix domain-containing protein [Patescibacteria group bacterium]|nr:helix-turn-helix domain-containing protein [Patescibacteria group bacterium]MBU1473161.1 helix-turn-helix domain-containing protein [Patescibacteria group bacterium]MBU2459779.1 helix-turn-helix domain-containing protein [Patescibacteria group bacterium]MBU2544622.1 helix-turn-helix domain-containing protein [Patescibacteria group bacterium]